MKRRTYLVVIIAGFACCLIAFRSKIRSVAASTLQTVKGRKTVAERVAQFGSVVHNRLGGRFKEIGMSYPPRKVVFVGLKHERLLEVWVSNDGNKFFFLKRYPILAASGTLGPKLAEGDRQVPEGLYKIASLNPNSLYHLSLRINYPNSFDKAKGQADGRTKLGGDIMIHGKSVSIGCLAMGDDAAEDLFVIAAETGVQNIDVILSPVDFRVRDLPVVLKNVPTWTSNLHDEIRRELLKLRH